MLLPNSHYIRREAVFSNASSYLFLDQFECFRRQKLSLIVVLLLYFYSQVTGSPYSGSIFFQTSTIQNCRLNCQQFKVSIESLHTKYAVDR